ncbi:MAG: hypothetical protein KAG98_05255 [Lentisphaeria bacterium]|nr:hypothetical protein [Lentisphaeria bacterium]
MKNTINHLILKLPPEATCFGYCKKCQEVHYLSEGKSRLHAELLMEELNKHQRIDFTANTPDPRFSTDYLWGEARGQMFGVLECEDAQGQTVILKAFSCQYNGEWLVNGWVPPLIDLEKCDKFGPPRDAKIKALTTAINLMEKSDPKRVELVRERKQMSRDFMQLLHSFYSLHNFAGEIGSLSEACYDRRGIPAGSGDCCAPKLLGFAAQHGFRPISLSEFYVGKSNKSNTRRHGVFYPACEAKCQPILGFMLCGK